MALITGTVNRLTEQVDYWQFLVDIENTSASKENVVRQSVFSRLAFFVGWELWEKCWYIRHQRSRCTFQVKE